MTEIIAVKQPYKFRINAETPIPARLPQQFTDEIARFVDSSKPADSDETYTDFLTGITEIIKNYALQLTADTPIFQQRLARIGRHEQTIATNWGGVFFREASEAKNHVEKYLIVKQAIDPSGVLGFEYHKRKKEKLQIEEGYVLLMQVDTPGSIALTYAGQGKTCELQPPVGHGIIPLTNATILETSNYELDADDLLFIFKPKQVI